MSGQIMSGVDVLIHNPMKEEGCFASLENEQEFRQTDHYGFFYCFFFSEHNRVMSLNSVQSGVRKQKSKISPT